MPRIVVPVGFHLGPHVGFEEPAGDGPAHFEVLVAGTPQELSAAEHVVWSAPFAEATRSGVTRAEVVRRCAAVPDPDLVVDDLIARGLLIEFDPERSPVRRLFAALQLHPLAPGLGSTAELPDVGRIGIRGEPVIAVSLLTYQIWAHSRYYRSLWTVCEAVVQDPEPDRAAVRMSAEDVARVVAMDLSLLVLSGCAFLDRG